ncbi:MAG: hypothetical protein WAM30_09905 [Candidatus Dormiibacterota bacterium]
MFLASGLFPASWVGNTPFQLPFGVELVVYVVATLVCLAILATVLRNTRADRRNGRAGSGSASRWTTQDLLVVAIIGVLLEVYDNLIGDQFVTPLTQGIPFAHAFALNDLPYLFLLMVGIAIIRKPGATTALVFLNFLLMQLLYGSGESSPLWWPYGLMQGVFVDLYLLLRRGRVFSSSGSGAVVEGFVMGALRAVPAVVVASAVFQPLLNGATRTGTYILLYGVCNLLGNGAAAAISAPLAIRVARTVNPAVGYGEATAPNLVGTTHAEHNLRGTEPIDVEEARS